MRNRYDSSKREKSAAVGLVICFVAMIAVVGLITFSQYQSKSKQEPQKLAEAEKDGGYADEQEETDKEEPSQSANTDSIQAELDKPEIDSAADTLADDLLPSAVTEAPKLSFAANDVLQWPIDGNVILSYSMDNPVYFATLEQYKYNPALIISGEVGGEVLAAIDGKVLSVETNAQTGTTITMDIGSGYQAVYGQLKEVCVGEGDYVSEGAAIGYVSEPTKYYSVEGPNLYFQLLKDGEPVNPLEYLDV